MRKHPGDSRSLMIPNFKPGAASDMRLPEAAVTIGLMFLTPVNRCRLRFMRFSEKKTLLQRRLSITRAAFHRHKFRVRGRPHTDGGAGRGVGADL